MTLLISVHYVWISVRCFSSHVGFGGSRFTKVFNAALLSPSNKDVCPCALSIALDELGSFALCGFRVPVEKLRENRTSDSYTIQSTTRLLLKSAILTWFKLVLRWGF
ncbi:hypothetical protein TNCT_628141 [Trichonephila clavata]|uniref:Uncharacterized protein n=1 Tax=Trichonephila clavata TaxID=2740835 RepID=A0A8X6HIN7_TRICU|nr:hypothetical protein TNCT_628141 [Trichonephila clavata]